MTFTKATKEYAEPVFWLVQDTIQAVYPSYYPTEAVRFFRELHSRENIGTDIESGFVRILLDGDMLVGTGSRKGNHITRVFVASAFQGKGYGNRIMQQLEDEIALEYDTVHLDASLPAGVIYEHRGYNTVKHDKHPLEHGVILAYEIMEKSLPAGNSEPHRKR